MKILMVTTSLNIGGAETHIITLARALERAGHTVELASAGGVYAESEGFAHHTVPFLPYSPLSPAISAKRLAETVRKGKFDVIHAHSRIAAFLCHAIHAGPLVTTAHWPFRTAFPYGAFSKWGERTLAVCPDIRDYLLREYKLPPSQVRLTVNGIDTERFHPFGREKAPRLLHVSRLDQGRAETAELLITAMPALLQKHKDLTLTLVGDGALYKKLAKQAAALNEMANRQAVVMVGSTNTPEKFFEGQPIFIGVSRAALEAMASASPVILCGDEGFLSLFSPTNEQQVHLGEYTNYCCRNASPLSFGILHRALEEALSLSKEQRQALGRAGREYVQQRYSPKRMAEDALLCYEEVARKIFCGYYGGGNLGDELSLRALSISTKNPCYISWQKGFSAPFRTLRAIHRMRPGTTFLLGGGNLLQNETSNRSLLYYSTLFRLAARRGCRCELVSAGIGGLDGAWAKKQCEKILTAADRIALRTVADAEAARELAPSCVDKIRLTHDAVLEHPFLNVAPLSLPTRYAVVALRPPKTDLQREKERILLPKLLRTVQECGVRILFLSMQPQTDRAYAALVMETAQSGELWDATANSLPALIGGAAFTLCTRLHAALLSLRFGIPCYTLPGYAKLEALYRDLEWMHPQNPALTLLTDEKTAFPIQEPITAKEERKKKILALGNALRLRNERYADREKKKEDPTE